MMNNTTARCRAPVSYRLSSDDLELRQVMPLNIADGFFTAGCDPAVFFDKCAQHQAVRRLAPDLAFDGRQVASLDRLPPDDGRAWVVRPALSPSSRGSAVLLGGQWATASQVAALLDDAPGPFQIHVHEPGYPVFINGVLDAGEFHVTDAWRCHTLDLEGRRLLTAVNSLPSAVLPARLVPQLAALANGLGMLHGPLHAEVVITSTGARLVKLSPRLASTPLPQLCRLGGWPAQEDCWKQWPQALGQGPTQGAAVADYSFVITRAGRVKAFLFDREVRSLESFSHYFVAPPVGKVVAMTTDGTTYGCTVFLRNHCLEKLTEEIAMLQSLNLTDAFEID